MARYQKRKVIEDFISYQLEILSLEKEFCRRKKGPNTGDVRQTHFGTIVKTFVPDYGGTVVTFDVSGFQEQENNIKTTLKVGNMIEVSAWKDPDEVMRGCLMMIRGSELDIHLRHPKYLFRKGEVLELADSDDDEFDTLIAAAKDIRILNPKN